MKIAEMEDHHNAFLQIEGTVCGMRENREFPKVFATCCETFEHIVAAVKFRKKREIHPETPDWESFRVICEYAPPLFEHDILNSLLDFVKSTRTLAKHDNSYLSSVEAAVEDEELARSLWNRLEEQDPGFLQRDIRTELGFDQERAVAVVDVWHALGVLDRERDGNSYRLYFRSRLDSLVQGMCPECGVRGRARKEVFFRPTVCQKCGWRGYYHIVCLDSRDHLCGERS